MNTPAPTSIDDKRQLRDAFSAFITGVTVVTARNEDGVPLGFTANSFTSVSLSPPMLLVCPSRHLSSFSTFNQCRHFAVNILAENQRDIANRFATADIDRFAGIAWRDCPHNGSPLIDHAAAVFSCVTHRRVIAGDHLILIGAVNDYSCSGAAALGYANGGYFSLDLERRADALAHQARTLTVGIIIEHAGKVLLCPTENDKLTLPQVQVADHSGSLETLQQFLQDAGLAVDIGTVYAVVENKNNGAHSIYYRGNINTTAQQQLGNFYPIAELAQRAEESLTVMLQRYYQEHTGGNFGLYIGDQDAGNIHRVATANRTPLGN